LIAIKSGYQGWPANKHYLIAGPEVAHVIFVSNKHSVCGEFSPWQVRGIREQKQAIDMPAPDFPVSFALFQQRICSETVKNQQSRSVSLVVDAA